MGADIGIVTVCIGAGNLGYGVVGVHHKCTQLGGIPTGGNRNLHSGFAGVIAGSNGGNHTPSLYIGSAFNGGGSGLTDSQTGQAGSGNGNIAFGLGDILNFRLLVRNKVVGIILCNRIDQSQDVRLVRLVVYIGVIEPYALHCTHGDHTGVVCNCSYGDRTRIVQCVVISIATCSTGNIVPTFVGVQNFVTLLGDVISFAGLNIAPAASPGSNHQTGIKGFTGVGIVVVDTVIECNGSHAQAANILNQSVDIFSKGVIQVSFDHSTKTHASCGIGMIVVGILVSTNIKILTTLGSKVLGVFHNQCLGKSNGFFVFQINGSFGSLIFAVDSTGGHSGQNGIHMAGIVHQGDDLDMLGSSIGDNCVHFSLGPLTGVGVRGVARLDSGFDGITIVGSTVCLDRHVIQKQTKSVITDCKFHVGETNLGNLVNQFLYLRDSKILPTAVQVEHAKEIIVRCVCCKSHGGQGGADHQNRQKPGNHAFTKTLLHFKLSFFRMIFKPIL